MNLIYQKIDVIDSTNDYIEREIYSYNISDNKVLIANEQTNGHGSKGRSFISAKDKGLYFTYAYKYENISETEFITQKVAVAVYLTFKELFNIEFDIKWVNDLYYKSKKICGILCKNLIKNNFIIMGIGIDLFKNDNLDESIKDIAGNIFCDYNELKGFNTKNRIDVKSIAIDKNIMLYTDDNMVLNDLDSIVLTIISNINHLIKEKDLPKLYIEKNIIKDKKIYEDYNLEC